MTRQIHGNTSGLAPSDMKALERIYRRKVPFDRLLTPELTRSMCEVSRTTGRQVGVLVDRRGVVDFVIVGDAHKLWLPDFGRLRASRGRFRGLRLLHTHLNQEGLTRDDLVDLTRLRLDLVAAVCMSPEGQPISVHYGHNVPVPEDVDEEPYRTYGPIPYGKLDVNPEQLVTALEEEFARAARVRPVEAKDGRAILVHVCDKKHALEAEDSLRELEELARTAGVDVADTVLQVRDKVDPKFVLGRGKVDTVVIRAMQLDVEVLIFDRNLTPAQSAALARVTDLKILDRTQLILDIFAQRAESRDGKLQVELAQMKYLLPRLGSRDDSLSRLTGGIGGRGPGETKLEIGRRRARERITRLERQLRKLGKQRKQRRSRRAKRGVPIVSIVGYTNAGKSTLLNALTESEVLAEDKLFATLDTRSRRIRFPREREVVITDTVGFIRDLPKDLFAAFRATFEEAQDADLLLHVVDVSDPSLSDHMETTERVLSALDLAHVPRLLVFNKADRLMDGEADRIAAARGGLAVSALDRSTLEPLLLEIERRLYPDGDEELWPRDDAAAEDPSEAPSSGEWSEAWA
ncbi:MAG TPA: GTPase HflX [Sandaracinaceae bacterium LLY-WYZ-13_1]|nr:GTPase HflX [Sandaracinaceae bacterium LLY-WYZ-13_1]